MIITWSPDPIRAQQPARLRLELESGEPTGTYIFGFDDADDEPFGEQTITHRMYRSRDYEPEATFARAGTYRLYGRKEDSGNATGNFTAENLLAEIEVAEPDTGEVPDQKVALVSAPPPPSQDAVLWTFIDAITNQLRFEEFDEFLRQHLRGRGERSDWYGTAAYATLREAGERFVQRAADPLAYYRKSGDHEISRATVQGGVRRSYVSSEGSDLAQPFLQPGSSFGNSARPSETGAAETPSASAAAVGEGERVAFFGPDATRFPLPNVPFVELLWNYWMEEAHLVQTLNHIVARFQNRRVGSGRDPLARFDLNPLLPLRNLIWGFAEDEATRLTVRRRAAEYEYQYGLRLIGRAVPPPSLAVERRVQFLESFHGLLNASFGFFKERDDKTVDADAFPLLSSLREVHLGLSHGAHNQFADLPLTARGEMLVMQWLLAQPEMREFLGGPTMVPYEEAWMDRVDTMKQLQGWPDPSVTHFFDLAYGGERICLSVRHGRWNESARTREDAANWAINWRNDIQRYMHAYRAVTGVDLTVGIDATMPSLLIARRARLPRLA